MMSLGPSLPLAPCYHRERESTRVKHRSRVVLITWEARGRAPRVLTAPFGLDRSPVQTGKLAGESAEYQNLVACHATAFSIAPRLGPTPLCCSDAERSTIVVRGRPNRCTRSGGGRRGSAWDNTLFIVGGSLRIASVNPLLTLKPA
jgi:hypothetical protein